MFLNAPDGTRIELFTDVGGNGDNFNDTILSDQADTSIASGIAPFAGTFSPEGSLSVLNGTELNGTWTLEIFDDFNQDQGTLNAWGINVILETTAVSTDFDGDGFHNCTDIDMLVAEMVAGTNGSGFDLNGDSVVDSADLDQWLNDAAAVNGLGSSYIHGDGNLDGFVDVSDFGVWNDNRFTFNTGWCGGDYNADGRADASDFNLWNENKFTSSDTATLADTGSDENVNELESAEAIEMIAETTTLQEVAVASYDGLDSLTNAADARKSARSVIDAVFAEDSASFDI